MDVHRPLEHGVRCAGDHHVEDRVDDFVALDAEDRGAEDLLARSVHQDLHEALRFAALLRAADTAHRHPGNERTASVLHDVALGHAGPAQGRIDVQRIGGHAIGDAAAIVVEQVGRHDLVVVVRGVGEGAAAVDVTQRPDARHAGAQLFVDRDVAARIRLHARLVEPEIVGVRPASDREQQVRALDLVRVVLAVESDADAAAAPRQGDALGVEPDLDALAFENLPDRRRHLLVLARDQPRAHLDDGDAGAEAPVHLGELQADVAAADHHQVLGQGVKLEHGAVREMVDLAQAGQVRHMCPRADVDEDLAGLELRVADPDRARAFEARMSLVDREIRRALEPLLHTLVGGPHHGVLACLDARHVDAQALDHHAEVGRAARQVSDPRARDQGLGGDAAGVDAGAAEQLALDDGGLAAGLRQAHGQ